MSDIIITILTIIHVFVSLFIVLLVMMQRPKQEGLGAAFGGGAMDGAFGAQTTNVLQKGTLYFGIAFFILSLALAILIGRTAPPSTGLGDSLNNLPEAAVAPAAATTEEGAAAPIVPALPTPQPAADAALPEAAPAPETTPAPATTAPEVPAAALPSTPEVEVETPAAPAVPEAPEAPEAPAPVENAIEAATDAAAEVNTEATDAVEAIKEAVKPATE